MQERRGAFPRRAAEPALRADAFVDDPLSLFDRRFDLEDQVMLEAVAELAHTCRKPPRQDPSRHLHDAVGEVGEAYPP